MIRWWKDYNFTMHMMFLLLLLITGTHGVYTVTLKASSKAFASTSNDIIINVRGPHSSTPDSTIDGVPNNQEKSVNIYKDVGLPSCVTARNTGSNGLLISWIKISSYSYDDVTLIVDEWIEKGKQEKITKCRSNCPAAYGKKGEVCRKCGDNTYSDGDSTYCKNCPGTQKSGVGATTCRPVTCNGGYRVGGHACNICPKNTYSKGGTSATCTDCKDNEGSDEGASACNLFTCNGGYRVGGHACNICPKNTYSKGGYSVTCTECEDNEGSDEGASTCNLLSCKDGEKADEHRCSTCPENTFAVQGDTNCTKCGDNQISTAGSGRCIGFCTSFPEEWNVTTELSTTLYEGDTISLRCGENYSNVGSDVVTCIIGETYMFSTLPTCMEGDYFVDLPRISQLHEITVHDSNSITFICSASGFPHMMANFSVLSSGVSVLEYSSMMSTGKNQDFIFAHQFKCEDEKVACTVSSVWNGSILDSKTVEVDILRPLKCFDKKKVVAASVSGWFFVVISVIIAAAFLLNRRRKRVNRKAEANLQGLHNNPMYAENTVDRKENTDEYVYMQNRNPMPNENTKDRKKNSDKEEHIYSQV